MRVRLSVNSGFCWGVKRAFDKVLGALQCGDTVHTLGPLVHNENAIRMLEKRGLRACREVSQIESGTVVVRAHGIVPELEQELLARGLHVVDATCPHVRRIQQRVEKAAEEGRHTCIVGYRDHPEVVALAARAGDACSVIANVGELSEVPTDTPIFLAVQSTFNRSLFEEIRHAVTRDHEDVVVFDSICRATSKRQQEVRSLAGQVEAVVVVGSHTSSNTKRLAEIAGEEGVPTFHVTAADELDPARMSRFGTVAVVSGASTPNWVTRRVVEALLDVSPGGYGVRHMVRRLFLGMVESGLYASVGAAALTVAACRLQRVPVRWEYLAAALCYIFSIYTLSRLQQRGEEPAPTRRVAFLHAHLRTMSVVAVLFAVAAVGIATRLGTISAALIGTSYLLGIGYAVPIIPKKWGFRYKRLQDIPASKDLFAAGAWTAVCAIIPFAHAGALTSPAAAVATWMFVFLTVSAKATMYDSVDIQGDRVVGRETLPALLGERKTWQVCGGLLAASSASLAAVAIISSEWTPLALLAGPAYATLYLPLLRRGTVRLEDLNVVIVDGQLFLLGALSYILSSQWPTTSP